jgi:hypothetical protein
VKPNVVLLTTGCANSTVTARMLGALGWNLGDADEEYAESVSVRAVNVKEPFDAKAARAALAGLPQPWVAKDPRFARTLRHWLPLLAPYRPLLLYVTKNLAYVRASMARRFGMDTGTADRRAKWCESYFASWPWAKLQLDADQIAAAVRLFDPDRPYRHALPPGP